MSSASIPFLLEYIQNKRKEHPSMAKIEFKVELSDMKGTGLAGEAAQDPAALTRDQLLGLYKQQAQLIEQLQLTMTNLRETIEYLTRKLYGASREKLPMKGQLDLFGNEYVPDQGPEPGLPPDDVINPGETEKKPKAKRSKREELFSDIPTEEKLIPVPEEERTCEICGRELVPVGKERVRSEIIITPMQVKQVVYYAEVLACSNCKQDYGSFAYKKPEVPAPLMPHSMASASSVSYVIQQKFVNSLTFYRLEKELEALGAPIGRETMADWIIYSALNVLKPLSDLLFIEQKLRDVLHGDETWCQVLKEPGKDPESKSYIWLIVTGDDGLPPIVTYHYSPTRAHTAAQILFSGFNGYLHTDKYDGYNCLEDQITRCLCWAHGRRKWFEAISPEIKNRDRSKLGLDDLTAAEIGLLYCDKLFEIERGLKGLSAEERYERRLKEAVPVLESFWKWLVRLKPLGGSKLEKAVNYFKDAREGFENYLKDGRCSLSNNLAENNARPYVIGRKNFLFHNSVDGANASAIIYSIVLSAKANNLDIRQYMETLLLKMPDYKNEPEGIRRLLPWSPEMQAECHR